MKTRNTTAHVTLDIDDVIAAGTVEKAILAWAEQSDDTSSGVIGSEFSTSGPGSGWTKHHDADDFAARAFEGGALHYIDAEDGRMMSVSAPVGEVTEDDDGERVDEDGNTVLTDIGGCDYVEGDDWSDESVVRLECPALSEAVENPSIASHMASEVVKYHGAESDLEEWAELVRKIKNAAELFESIDAEDFDE